MNKNQYCLNYLFIKIVNKINFLIDYTISTHCVEYFSLDDLLHRGQADLNDLRLFRLTSQNERF